MLSEPAKTYLSAGGSPTVDSAVDPIAGGGNPCKTTPAADQSGVATWRFPAATGSGYTLLGSPTVIADLKLTGAFPHVVARLWDVAPGGTQTLVARGLYRPTANGRQVFQLHPNGWRFAAGHTAKVELLGKDVPYARPSNGTFSVEVSKVDIRLPVAEKPGTGPVTAPAPNFKPGDVFPFRPPWRGRIRCASARARTWARWATGASGSARRSPRSRAGRACPAA